MSERTAELPWHSWPRKHDQPLPAHDQSQQRRFPVGAEWVERMRLAGYEPFVGRKNGHKQVFAKGQGAHRDKKVFARMANEVDVAGRVRTEVIGYLEATANGRRR